MSGRGDRCRWRGGLEEVRGVLFFMWMVDGKGISGRRLCNLMLSRSAVHYSECS